MECGKLTAKLRDAVPVCFMVNDHEVKRYKNIEIPKEIKHLEYCGFRFDVPKNGAITFKIWFNEGILPEVWPAERVKLRRSKNDGEKAPKEKQVPATVELHYGVTGPDRKTNALLNKTADFEIACRIRRYIDAIKNDPTNPDNNPDWIDWASKKADWLDPTVAREDEFFGKRKHGQDVDQKELKRRW